MNIYRVKLIKNLKIGIINVSLKNSMVKYSTCRVTGLNQRTPPDDMLMSALGMELWQADAPHFLLQGWPDEGQVLL